MREREGERRRTPSCFVFRIKAATRRLVDWLDHDLQKSTKIVEYCVELKMLAHFLVNEYHNSTQMANYFRSFNLMLLRKLSNSGID